MECNHPAALYQKGSDGLTHCGICWAIIEDKPEEKPEEKKPVKKRTKKEQKNGSEDC